jgi:hypothetical protein
MGACFNTMTAKGTPQEVRKAFEQKQEQDRYENGHVYSGGLGMAPGLTFTNKTFDDTRDAYEWLADHAQKWDNALAVKIGDEYLIGAWCSS